MSLDALAAAGFVRLARGKTNRVLEREVATAAAAVRGDAALVFTAFERVYFGHAKASPSDVDTIMAAHARIALHHSLEG